MCGLSKLYGLVYRTILDTSCCFVYLQCSDDVVFARSMIDDIISNCVEEVQKHDTPQTNASTSKDLAAMVTNLCVEDCQNGGSCEQGMKTNWVYYLVISITLHKCNNPIKVQVGIQCCSVCCYFCWIPRIVNQSQKGHAD